VTAAPSALTLANARLVLADEVIEAGWIVAENGVISDFGRAAPPARAEDMDGDLVMPGLVELHTDHIEAHYMPRPKVHWDPVSAVVSYDAQLATCGITTVLDSLRVWREESADEVDGEAALLAAAITTARDADMLRITHYLHLRCEVPTCHPRFNTSPLASERRDIQGNESRLTRLWLQRAENVQQVLRVPGGALAAALD
jgi:alpha-D-ribose 1-methylphosphonate 5-triphosphate diphosphatase